VKQQKAVATRRRPITPVQPIDGGPPRRQQVVIPLSLLTFRVGPVGQKRVVKLALGARQIVYLEPLDLLLDLLDRIEQDRHGDERA